MSSVEILRAKLREACFLDEQQIHSEWGVVTLRTHADPAVVELYTLIDALIAATREDERASYILALATDLTTRADGLSPVGDTRSFADVLIADAYRWVARAVSNGAIPRST